MRILTFTFLFLANISCFGAITLTGNSTDNNDFTFLIHKGQMSENLFFVAANEAVSGNKYAAAVAGGGNKKFIPLAPEKIKLNNKESQANPLYGAKVSDMYVSGTTPVLVVDGSKKVLQIENANFAPDISILQSDDINDSNSAVANSIIKVGSGGGAILAAVTGSGTFGDSGSGIALTIVRSTEEKTKVNGKERSVLTRSLVVLDASTGKPTNKALPFTGATDALKSGNDATINSNVIDIHYSSVLNRFYIALDLTSGVAATDKIRAVAIGRLSSNDSGPILNIDAIVSADAISGTNQIVAAEGAATTVAISKVKTMSTTTHLDYLVVAGGNGTSGNTVYALPLVNRSRVTNVKLRSDSTHGSLAKASQTPTDYYDTPTGAFITRSYLTPATSSSDLLTTSSDAAKVGAGTLPIEADDLIADMFIVKDSVYVSISDDSGTNEVGLWCSQAIFDSEGKVANWTAWQKVAGTTGKVFSGGLDMNSGNFVYVTDNSSGEQKVVKRTIWSDGSGDGLLGGTTSNGSDGLLSLVYSALPQSEGGAQGYSFFKSTGLTSSFNILCTTGLNKVLLAKTRNSGGSVVGDFSTNSASSTDGSMPTATSNANFVSIAGGNLRDLGAITTSAIVTNGSGYWLVVGGAYGLAILADSSGNGWTSSISSFAGMSGSFKKIGSFSFVRKIISNSNYLYILTSNGLYRTALTSSGVLNNNLSFTTLAQIDDANSPAGSAFFDVLISLDFCLLASSLGLYRTGDGQSISSATSAAAVNWTQVNVPDGLQSIVKLIPVSSTLEEPCFSRKGQVYVLSSYIGYQLSKLNRFYINLGDSVDANTILPVPDRFFNTNSYLVNFGDFRSSFFTNGSLFISSRSKDVAGDLSLDILTSGFKSGFKFLDASAKNIDAGLAEFYQVGNLSIVPYLGSMIFNGDFGFRVNE